MNRGRVLFIASSCARNGFVVSREEIESSMSWITNWQTCPTDDDHFYDVTDSCCASSNSITDCHWQRFGIEIGRYHGYGQGEYETFSFWRISYPSIVVPLILISLGLLVIQPRKSIPQKITEPIAEKAASILGESFKGWRRKTGLLTLAIALIPIGGFGVVQFAKWRHTVNYPYGWSRCCV